MSRMKRFTCVFSIKYFIISNIMRANVKKNFKQYNNDIRYVF